MLSGTSLLLSRNLFVFDIFSHFQLQYMLALLLISPAVYLLGDRKIAILSIAYVIIISTVFIIPIQTTGITNFQADIYYMNLNFRNENLEPIVEEIKNSRPQIVAIVESNIAIEQKLSQLYGPPIVSISEEGQSCSIFSQTAPKEVLAIKELEYPLCYARFESFDIITMHPYPPLSDIQFAKQKIFFKQVSDLYDSKAAGNRPVILVGDFNSTYYSGLYRRYFGRFGKVNYYSWMNRTLVSLPIDHALANVPIKVNLAPKLTSDHSGLYIQLP